MYSNEGRPLNGDHYWSEKRGRNDSPEVNGRHSGYSSHRDSYNERSSSGYERGGGRGGSSSREDGYSRRGGHDSSYRHDSRNYGSHSDSNSHHSYSSSSRDYSSSYHSDNRSHRSSYDRDSEYSPQHRSRSSSDRYDRYSDRKSPHRSHSSYDEEARSSRYDRSDRRDHSPSYGFSSGYRGSDHSMDIDRRTSSSDYHDSEHRHSPQRGNQNRYSDSSSQHASSLNHSSSSFRYPDDHSKSFSGPPPGPNSIDTQLLSMSRAPTQPLEGYAPQNLSTSMSVSSAPVLSHSATLMVGNTTNIPPIQEKYPNALSSMLKALVASLPDSIIDKEGQDAFKAAVDSNIASLQAIQNLETEIAKSRANQMPNLSKIEEAENAVEQLYVEYYAADYNSRLTEGDYETTSRIVHGLEAVNGEWPAPNWTCPAYQSFDELAAAETGLDASEQITTQN